MVDFDILTTTLRENHPMMGLYISRDSFDRMCEQLALEIRHGQTISAFHDSVSHLLQSIGCGHTYTYPSPEMNARMKWMNNLPFGIVVIDTTIYITEVLKPEYQKYKGAQVFSINDHPAAEMIYTAFGLISSDGYNTTYKAYKFRRSFNYYLQILLERPDSLLVHSSAGNFTVKYPTSFLKAVPEEAETGFSELPDVPGTVVLSVPHFDGGKGRIKACFKYMNLHQTDNLVVDLRDNGGGRGDVGAYLVSYIIDTTLTYYVDKQTNPMRYKEYMKKKEGLVISNRYTMKDSMTRSYDYKVKPKTKCNFDGRVFVITNGGTFSTGSYVASALKHAAGAICVGEETGGSEFAIGGGVIGRFVLPYSQVNVRLPLYRWRFNVVAEDRGTGVLPDMKIIPDPASLVTEEDPELRVIKKMIAEGLPSGG